MKINTGNEVILRHIVLVIIRYLKWIRELLLTKILSKNISRFQTKLIKI